MEIYRNICQQRGGQRIRLVFCRIFLMGFRVRDGISIFYFILLLVYFILFKYSYYYRKKIFFRGSSIYRLIDIQCVFVVLYIRIGRIKMKKMFVFKDYTVGFLVLGLRVLEFIVRFLVIFCFYQGDVECVFEFRACIDFVGFGFLDGLGVGNFFVFFFVYVFIFRVFRFVFISKGF